jgi:hypothetical protein
MLKVEPADVRPPDPVKIGAGELAAVGCAYGDVPPQPQRLGRLGWLREAGHLDKKERSADERTSGRG